MAEIDTTTSIIRTDPPLNSKQIPNIRKLEFPTRTSKEDIELIKNGEIK